MSDVPRSRLWLAALLVVVAPLWLLAPCLFGSRVFLPFDLALFPPAATLADDAQRAAIVAQPAHTDVSELPALVLPEIELARAELDAGRIPAWNPGARFGAPLYANSLAALTYPSTWIPLASDRPEHGLAAVALLGYAAAGLAMLAFLRACGAGVLSALFGALAFQLCGTLTTNAHFYMRMNALVWLPALLLGCLGVARRRGASRAWPAVGLALATAMVWLAGFPPFAIACSLFAGLYGLALCAAAARNDGPRQAGALALWLGAGFGLGLCFAAVQLVPAFAYFPESNRQLAPGPNAVANQGFDPMGLLGYVMPHVFGTPGLGSLPYDKSALAYLLYTRSRWVDDDAGVAGSVFFPHDYNFTEYTVFAGTLPLLLALVGVLAGRGLARRWLLLAIGLAFAVLAAAPWFTAPVFALPGIRNVPPMRFIGPLCAVVAALAAAGFDAVLRDRSPRAVRAVAAVAFALAAASAVLALWAPGVDLVGALAERYRERLGADPRTDVANFLGADNVRKAGEHLVLGLWRAAASLAAGGAWLLAWQALRARGARAFAAATAVTVVATFVELTWFALPQNHGRTLPVAHDTPVHAFLRAQRDAAADAGGITIGRAAEQPRGATDLACGTLFPDRVRDLNAYAFVDRWSHRPWRQLYGPEQMVREYWPMAFPDDDNLELPYFDLIGLRYVLSAEPELLEHAGSKVAFELTGPGGHFRVYERATALPRAFVVHEVRELADDDAVIAALIAPDLEPRRAVLLTPAERARLTLPVPPAPAAAGRAVRFSVDHTDEIVLEVAAGAPGYLVLADTALSGWAATVGGKPAEIARGNLFMRVLPVDASDTTVRFVYTPPGLALGAAVTAVAVLAAAAALAIAWRSSRRRKTSEPSL